MPWHAGSSGRPESQLASVPDEEAGDHPPVLTPDRCWPAGSADGPPAGRSDNRAAEASAGRRKLRPALARRLLPFRGMPAPRPEMEVLEPLRAAARFTRPPPPPSEDR